MGLTTDLKVPEITNFKREGLFYLTVLETSGHNQLALLLWDL
jgi:hypothetical protein